MCETGRAKDILVQAFLNEGLAIRNRELTEHQKQVAMAILARRNDIIARKKAYRAFILLENGIAKDYREPTFKYGQSLYLGRRFLEANTADVEYGRRYPRVSKRLFQYLKTRVGKDRARV